MKSLNFSIGCGQPKTNQNRIINGSLDLDLAHIDVDLLVLIKLYVCIFAK